MCEQHINKNSSKIASTLFGKCQINVKAWISDLQFETMLKRLTSEQKSRRGSELNPAAPELGAGHVRLWPQSSPHSWACNCLSVCLPLCLSPPPTSSLIACPPKGIYTHHGQSQPCQGYICKMVMLYVFFWSERCRQCKSNRSNHHGIL